MSKSSNRPFENTGSNNNKSRDVREESVLDEVTEKARSAGKIVREFADTTKENLSEIQDKALDRLRTNPVSTCAIIFFSGVLLGAIMRK